MTRGIRSKTSSRKTAAKKARPRSRPRPRHRPSQTTRNLPKQAANAGPVFVFSGVRTRFFGWSRKPDNLVNYRGKSSRLEHARNPHTLDENLGAVQLASIETEMRISYLDYAMSVIVQRALPDARDGLKPVQRRILYAHVTNMGMRTNSRYRKAPASSVKCSRTIHPHSDNAVYDTLVRMAQDFNLRYPLVDRPGQLRLGRWRRRGGHALHRMPPVADRRRDAGRHRQGHRRFQAELRRQHREPIGPAGDAAQSAASTARPASRSAWRPTSRPTT